jgi:phospholipid/cholesterol/gamma-HCH transport system substrate-binding protein
MPRDTHWRSLVPGVLALAALAAIALSVLVFARVGALHGDVMRLYAPTGQARGVLEGTEVWLEGKKIGRVTGVGFAPVTADTSRRLVIVMDVLSEYAHLVRRDSYAQVRTGNSLIGAPVVFITVGSARFAQIANEDTLTTKPQEDAESTTGRFAEASQSFPAIIANVTLLSTQLTTSTGTIGSVLSSGEGIQPLTRVGGNANRLLTHVMTGTGTVGLTLNGGALQQRVATLRARADSVTRLMSSTDASVGRFRRDSTLMHSLTALRAETDSVSAMLADSRGTAGRVLHDRALLQGVTAARAQIDSVITDVKAHPLRYVAF